MVTGGRDFRHREWLWAGLDRLHELSPITHLIEGGADGADRYAGEWAKREGIQHTTVYAQWHVHGKKAGYLRNAQMAEMLPDLVFAAPGGKGTAMMIEIARKQNIRIVYLNKMDVIRPPSAASCPATASR